MTEGRVARAFLYTALAFSVLAARPAQIAPEQIEGDECTDTDSRDHTIVWVDEEIPMRIYASPDSPKRGMWPKGTELYGLCFRIIKDTQNGLEVETLARYMRSAQDGRRGWAIAFYDRPLSGPPQERRSFVSIEAEVTSFDRSRGAREEKYQKILEEAFGS